MVFNRRWILNSGIFLIKNLKCQNSYMSELVLELQLALSVINKGQQTWLLNGWFIIVNPMTTFDDTAVKLSNFFKIFKFSLEMFTLPSEDTFLCVTDCHRTSQNMWQCHVVLESSLCRKVYLIFQFIKQHRLLKCSAIKKSFMFEEQLNTVLHTVL